jgi:hypothetical protein
MYRAIIVGAVLMFVAFALPGNAQLTVAAASVISGPDQFSAVHSALDRAANTLIADSVWRMAEAASDDDGSVRSHSPEVLIHDFDQRYRPNLTPSAAAALRRVVQLRPLLIPILEDEGIPREVAAVVLVESGGKNDALSPKGALGLWQLMPDTARRYGLVVTDSNDERLDVENSTRAAAHYLRDLYQQFGSWPLSLAAYNAGERAVQKAVYRAGNRDFTELSRLRLLPEETRNYVPAVLSAMGLLGASQLPEEPRQTARQIESQIMFAIPRAQP